MESTLAPQTRQPGTPVGTILPDHFREDVSTSLQPDSETPPSVAGALFRQRVAASFRPSDDDDIQGSSAATQRAAAGFLSGSQVGPVPTGQSLWLRLRRPVGTGPTLLLPVFNYDVIPKASKRQAS